MKVLHVNDTGRFVGGVERIAHDTATGLVQRGWTQGLLHDDANPAGEFVAGFSSVGRDLDFAQSFAPDAVLVHKAADPVRVETLARRYRSIRMVHDHDLVCLRRHKYFPLGLEICDRPAGLDCYTHLCFVQRAAPGSRLPIGFSSVSAQRRLMRANDAMAKIVTISHWMRNELVMNGFANERIDIIPPVPASLTGPSMLAPKIGRAHV